MATDFPGASDNYTNPSSSDKLNNPSHSVQHQNHNDAVEAIEAKLGTGASTPTANKVLRATGTGVTSYGQVDVTTDVASFTSANLRTLLSDETGTGSAVFATSPTITTPTIADFTNSTHNHTNAAGGGTLGTGSVSSASILSTGVVTSPKLETELQKGWQSHYGGTQFPAPSTVTNNGNGSYDLVFNSVDLTGVVSEGMFLRLTNSVTAPTQCADLEASSSQYFNDTSVSGMTFTDDFVCGAWVKLESSGGTIESRYNGTSGWDFVVLSDGKVQLAGFNASSANYSLVKSYQSLPLGRWVHVTAQLDMSAFTATSTTSYIMFDGVDVPSEVTRAGTNPTALVQAGNLEIGGRNGGLQPFDGKLAQAFVSSAKITQANVRTLISQGLTASLISTHSIISAYSLSNDITDLNTTNANNLTAQNSAVATNADSPFGLQADGTTAGTTNYAIVMKTAFSTNTTLTVQVPEGNTIPTSGGVSAVAYSAGGTPYGMIQEERRWEIETINRNQGSNTSAPTVSVWYNLTTTNVSGGFYLTIPTGKWEVSYLVTIQANGASPLTIHGTLSTANNSETDITMTSYFESSGTVSSVGGTAYRSRGISLSSATPYYFNTKYSQAGPTAIYNRGEVAASIIRAKCAYI